MNANTVSVYRPNGKSITVMAREGEEMLIVDSPVPGVCYLHIYPKPDPPHERAFGHASYVKLNIEERENLIAALKAVED